MFSIDNILNDDIVNFNDSSPNILKPNVTDKTLRNKINNIITKCVNMNNYQKLYDREKINIKCNKLTNKIIRKIFDHIDKNVFDDIFNEYIGYKYKHYNDVEKCYIGLTKKTSNDTTIGYFFVSKPLSNAKKSFGIKISKQYFENIMRNNILNIDLGSVDESNKKIYSQTVYDPLISTIEHEMIHMLIYMGNTHPMIAKDKNKKSGHTPVFKKIVYNIFGQKRVTHIFDIGDTQIVNDIKKMINLGDYVTYNKINGYIVDKNEHSAIIYTGEDYVIAKYNMIQKNIDNGNMMGKNINNIWETLKIGMQITYDGRLLKIIKINNKTIYASSDSNVWRIHKFRALEFAF